MKSARAIVRMNNHSHQIKISGLGRKEHEIYCILKRGSAPRWHRHYSCICYTSLLDKQTWFLFLGRITENRTPVAGSWSCTWQLSCFSYRRDGKLFERAATPLWQGSHVVSPLDQHVMMRYVLAMADAVWWGQVLVLVMVGTREVWQRRWPKRMLGLTRNGALRHLISKAGQQIESVTLEDSCLLVAHQDFWEKGPVWLTSIPLSPKPQRTDPLIFEALWNVYKKSRRCADLACYFKAGYWSECGLDRLWKRGRRKGRRKVK